MMTPQQRDRMMQVYLAQARGPQRNGDLLRSLTNAFLRNLSDTDAKAQTGREANTMGDPLLDTLTAVTDCLEHTNCPYAITGSLASSVHGEPHASLNADIILLASEQDASAIARALAPRFYAPVPRLTQAARACAFANIIDNDTSMKIDLSFVPNNGYLRECIDRRVRKPIGGSETQFWFVTQEDIILMKLLWRKDTRSTKQWENALSVARVKGTRMDWAYLFDKARDLDIEDDLTLLRDEAGI